MIRNKIQHGNFYTKNSILWLFFSSVSRYIYIIKYFSTKSINLRYFIANTGSLRIVWKQFPWQQFLSPDYSYSWWDHSHSWFLQIQARRTARNISWQGQISWSAVLSAVVSCFANCIPCLGKICIDCCCQLLAVTLLWESRCTVCPVLGKFVSIK